ncbi:TPA: hypothetical protein ACV20N_002403 [Acinetobacter baumannii]
MNRNNPFFNTDKIVGQILDKKSPDCLKRKELELELVQLIHKYQKQGLWISFIGIDVKDGIDARVTLCQDRAENLAV